MSGHTPGPWRVEDDRYVYGGSGFFQRIAEIEGCTEDSALDTTLADLRLIAAAPELLKACVEAVEGSLTDSDCCCYCGRDIDICEREPGCPMHTCRLAIAKAEG